MAKQKLNTYWTHVFGHNFDNEEETLEEDISVRAQSPNDAADVASEYADMDYVDQVDIYSDKHQVNKIFTVLS